MAFTEEEAAYLRSQPLARIATVGPDWQPDVAPVGFEYDGTYLYVGGRAPERTRKLLNVEAGQAKVALVVDDLVSTAPWTPRGLRVYGSAELIEREGMFGPGAYMRITPEISWSWNLAGQPFGAGGSGPRRTVPHGAPVPRQGSGQQQRDPGHAADGRHSQRGPQPQHAAQQPAEQRAERPGA